MSYLHLPQHSSLTSSPCLLSRLPDELQLHILSLLDLADLVKLIPAIPSLYPLISDPALWTKLDLCNVSKDMPGSLFMGMYLKYILPKTGHRLLELIVPFRKHILQPATWVHQILIHTPHIRVIVLTGYDKVNKSLCRLISENCHELKHLGLGNVKQLDDDSVVMLSSSLPLLETLDISTNYVSQKISDRALLGIAQYCSGLKHLYMVGCSQLTDIGLGEIATTCPGLTHFDAQGCFRISTHSITKLLRSCPQLSHLDLSYCWRTTDEAFILVGLQYGFSLYHVNLQFCYQLTNISVTSICRCQKLKYLNVGYCPSIQSWVQKDAEERRLHIDYQGCSQETIFPSDTALLQTIHNGKFQHLYS